MDKELSFYSDHDDELDEEFPEPEQDEILGEDLDDGIEDEEMEEDDEFSED